MTHPDHLSKKVNSSLPAGARVLIALVLPVGGALAVAAYISGGSPNGIDEGQNTAVLLFGPLAFISWLLGLRWYGLPGMGLRGQRPLFAGIGFAVLGWLSFLVLRFYFIKVLGYGQADSGRSFIYLLLFEAFAVQVWVFGVLFRSAAEWRGPLSAVFVCGLIFGIVANLLFQEAYISSVTSFFYFSVWGILIGIIRLRTGSFLGTIVVQPLQSFTAWNVLVPPLPPNPAHLQSLYIASSIAFLVILWRLWPKRVDDYRV